MAIISELVINMSANMATLQKDFAKAARMAQEFADGVKTALSVVGVGLSIGGLESLVKQTADFGEEISRAAQKAAMSVEQISALKFAAETTGTQFDTLQRSLVMFEKNVAGLGNTNTKAAEAIQALGIKTKDAEG